MSSHALRKTSPDGSVLDDRTFRAVYEFLSLESDCLGCGDLPTWQALLAPQIRYRVMAPAFLDAARPRHYGRGTIGARYPVDFRGTQYYRDKPIADFHGPGTAYPSTYSEMSEFALLIHWQNVMRGGV